MTDRPAVRNTDPDTSHAAWDSVEPKAEILRGKVLARVRMSPYGGYTTSELAALLELPRDSISPRIAELRHKGLVFDSGFRRLMLETNRRQIVWTDKENEVTAKATEQKKQRRTRLTPQQIVETQLGQAKKALDNLAKEEAGLQAKLTAVTERRTRQEAFVGALQEAISKLSPTVAEVPTEG